MSRQASPGDAGSGDRGSFAVRPATTDDADELHRLVGLLAAHVGDSDVYASTPDTFRRYGFGPQRRFESLLAVDEMAGLAVGACVYLPDFSTWLARPGVYILDLIVESEHRGRGIGSALLTEAARRGRDQWNADYVILSVARTNHGAIGFYQREGFVVDDDSQVMIRRGLGDLRG